MKCKVTGEPNCKCAATGEVYDPPTIKETLQKLFTDHAVYTKFYIVSTLDKLNDKSNLASRLLANQTDIGTFMGIFIGEDNGNNIAKLLTEHILAAASALDALLTGNQDDINLAVKNVFDNSKQVAKLLNTINNKLNYEVAVNEFNKHNQFVIDMAQLHMNKNYNDEIKKYDSYYNHMIMFSDLIYYNIIKCRGVRNTTYRLKLIQYAK